MYKMVFILNYYFSVDKLCLDAMGKSDQELAFQRMQKIIC